MIFLKKPKEKLLNSVLFNVPGYILHNHKKGLIANIEH